ncbi:chain length determinant protein tyrosine kinase EpsG [Massilia sp. P8910]|uniref:Chain length determinant protein tyrosine kinase EpsG n=1 Tax=Massilia antarctica TaxID=2765360 RepID=A0AA48W4S3_9BURK|nr:MULTISPECIES: chain length determinant protein tyrosine kinase EpsG [Massilia]CUI08223.1 Tyrosine-protein kinase EpsD [Janthinobacterium sp. CG23_2]MCE3604911.1 chain length determinant protein tyrosine kinase EpsG [Massilia antarctica]MCY0914741.1 chain length determinant protein tyrosine kinase EpsG [Massilia sp. H27-R4]QPI47306.1 chain length determinant protein tyrosine kinase EpsG [Massilia antarctica]CUU32009.1 Tyrosine-protein kinase EpsD [Janthinobacterium sp. CG23_2]
MTQTELSLAASEKIKRADSSIGHMLLESGKITPENAERVLRMQKELGIRFGEAAQRLGLINEADIQQVLARQFDYPYLQPGEGSYSPHLVAAYDPFSPQVETLRAVRSQLMLRWFARGRKSLTVVGIDRGDGASLFAANLAVVFSQLGEHTLLVDANLRTPAQHTIFNVAAKQGLSDVLAGRADLDVTAHVGSFLDLSVLGAGTLPPNPQELLSRSNFAGLNAQLESKYDVTLYDVAASQTGLDALVLAARTGGVLIVARKNKTHMGDVNALAEQVAQNGAVVVGSVLVDFK